MSAVTQAEARTAPITSVSAPGPGPGPAPPANQAKTSAAPSPAQGSALSSQPPNDTTIQAGMAPYHGTQYISFEVAQFRDIVIHQLLLEDPDWNGGAGRLIHHKNDDENHMEHLDVQGRLRATSPLMGFYYDLRLLSARQWDAMCIEWLASGPGSRHGASLSKVKTRSVGVTQPPQGYDYNADLVPTLFPGQQTALPAPLPQQPSLAPSRQVTTRTGASTTRPPAANRNSARLNAPMATSEPVRRGKDPIAMSHKEFNERYGESAERAEEITAREALAFAAVDHGSERNATLLSSSVQPEADKSFVDNLILAAEDARLAEKWSMEGRRFDSSTSQWRFPDGSPAPTPGPNSPSRMTTPPPARPDPRPWSDPERYQEAWAGRYKGPGSQGYDAPPHPPPGAGT